METLWAVALAAAIAVSGATVLILSAWRLVPKHPSIQRLADVEAEVTSLRLQLADLLDRFEVAQKRAWGRASGESRRLAKEETAEVVTPAEYKAGLRRRLLGGVR